MFNKDPLAPASPVEVLTALVSWKLKLKRNHPKVWYTTREIIESTPKEDFIALYDHEKLHTLVTDL